jgi:diguanylate cyclase (GGDEF)-like protein/PAS domain S-box-containing protein
MADGTRAEDRLRASEARLSEAQALAQLGSWEWDVVAGTVSWSDELYRIHGTRRGSFIPSFEAYLKLVHPDDRERVRGIVERAFADRQPFEFEERVVRPDGEERVLASRGRVFTDDAGEVVRLVGVCRDVTDQRQAAAALREAEERFRGAFETAAIGIALVSPDGRFLEVNEALCEIVGYDADELVRKTFQDITHPDDLEADLAYVRQVLAGEIRTYQMEKRYFHADGHLVWILLSVSLVRDEEGEPLYFVSQIEDVTERKRAEAATREAEERFRRAFEDAGVGMALIGVGPENAGRFLEVNDALLGISGHSREQLLSARFADIAHPDDVGLDGDGEMRILSVDGSAVWVSLSTSLVADDEGEPVYRIAQMQDISERKRFEGQLQYLADHDALTGLFNRRRFEEELGRELAAARRYGTGGAVLALDLDNFKYVNDSLGHALGDELIARVGELLHARLRESDILARLGGDEFAVILPHADEERARLVASELLEAIREEAVLHHENGTRRTTASIGIAPFSDNPERLTAEELLVEADIAMYDAKEAGRDQVCVFDAASGRQARMEARLSWVDQIREALAEDRLTLHAQPIVPLTGDEPVHHELLVRMVGKTGELIPPGTFLYVAERFDLIQEIDRWVVRNAIALLAEHQRAGRDVRFEVNLSAKSITDPALPAVIAEELERAGADPRRLIFEVTETAAIVNLDRAKQFARSLRKLGCGFALDDFGAGFASFYYLKHLTFDYLKIDGEFIEDLPKSKTNQLVVRAVVEIARGLGKKTIAEFVGDDKTVELLRHYGVDYAQGFHVGRPKPIAELELLPA